MHNELLWDFLRIIHHDPSVFTLPLWERRLPGLVHPFKNPDAFGRNLGRLYKAARDWLMVNGDSRKPPPHCIERAAWRIYWLAWCRAFGFDKLVEDAFANKPPKPYSQLSKKEKHQLCNTLGRALFGALFSPSLEHQWRFVRTVVKSQWRIRHPEDESPGEMNTTEEASKERNRFHTMRFGKS
jgi:hypothetical protein